MKVAVDTNILVYAEGLHGAERQAQMLELLEALPRDLRSTPVNVLGELFNVLTKKGKTSRLEARRRLSIWMEWGELLPTTSSAMSAAFDLAADHNLTVWDALVLAVAVEADCRLLLSLDMQDGFTWRGVTVVDPFARSPLLVAALRP